MTSGALRTALVTGGVLGLLESAPAGKWVMA